jgi:hypothetical protein
MLWHRAVHPSTPDGRAGWAYDYTPATQPELLSHAH